MPDISCVLQLLRSFWHSLAAWAIRGSLAVYEFLQTVCSPSEPPLHFVKVEVEPQHGEHFATTLQGLGQGGRLSMPELRYRGCGNRPQLCSCCNILSVLVQT